MKIRIIGTLIVAALFAGLAARAQVATTRLACTPTSGSSAVVPIGSRPAPIDPAVMAILKRLETADQRIPRLTADIDHHVEILQHADSEHRTGAVYYQAAAGETPAKFRIHFEDLKLGDGPTTRNVEDFVFDGYWLTVRKKRIKQMTRYQVVPPGGKVPPMELGKGPFPVPFGQKAEAMLKHFTATTRKPVKSDPADTDYLKLVTRPSPTRSTNLVWVEMWVARETGLPVKIVAADKSENITTVDFKKIKTPKSFAKKIFDLPRPPRSWQYRVELLGDNLKAPGAR